MKIVQAFIISTVLAVLVQAQTANRAVPDWARGAVWYQIFPERFCNGDTSNGPFADKVFSNSSQQNKDWMVRRWTSDWFGADEWESNFKGGFREALSYRRYGGDIQGIINKLDYLKNLGITAIYLNPVFEAVSLHKYDGSTFHHIDVNFGPDPGGDGKLIAGEKPDDPKTWKWTKADKLFLELLKEAHKRNMRIVIDGVFNHTGVQFWAFRDIVKSGRASQYFDWYQIKAVDDPATRENEFDYKCWWNIKSLPEFNRTAENLFPAVKEYIFSATKRWMDPNNDGNTEDGIDGWRLDVAREVPMGFWKEWSSLVRFINPQAIIIGELWELSPDFISQNGVFDAVMNYPFATAAYNFFINDPEMTAGAFIDSLKIIDAAYPDENLDLLQNLMDSHDTERLLSMIANPGRAYNREADERNENYNAGKPAAAAMEKMKLIAAFQYLYRGSPMIYYGDEVGMWGANDPYCRKPMVWDELLYDNEVISAASRFQTGQGTNKVKVDKSLWNFYRRLGAMRQACESLRFGSTEFLQLEGKRLLGFMRRYGNETVVAFFNLGDKSEIVQYPVAAQEIIDLSIGDAIKVENSQLRFPLWANSFAAYRIKH